MAEKDVTNLGQIIYTVCGEETCAFIRKKKKGGGNYPLYLSTKIKGPDFYNTRAGQDWILDNGVFYNEAGELPPAALKEPPVIPPVIPLKEKPGFESEREAKIVIPKKNDGWFL